MARNSDGSQEKRSLKFQRDKDREKVKGIFRFFEVPGGTMKFMFHAYKGDPYEKYELVDGEVCSIPLGVAKHLNKNGWYPIHSYALDADGKPSQRIGQKKRRFGFQSLEFVDIEELNMPNKEIITVENVVNVASIQ